MSVPAPSAMPKPTKLADTIGPIISLNRLRLLQLRNNPNR